MKAFEADGVGGAMQQRKDKITTAPDGLPL